YREADRGVNRVDGPRPDTEFRRSSRSCHTHTPFKHGATASPTPPKKTIHAPNPFPNFAIDDHRDTRWCWMPAKRPSGSAISKAIGALKDVVRQTEQSLAPVPHHPPTRVQAFI